MSLVTRLRSFATRSLSGARSFVEAMVLVCAVSACSGEATGSDAAPLVGSSDGVAAQPGWLVVDWTIAGAKDVAQCDRSHSATVALSVAAASGEPRSAYQRTCTAFNATLTLPAGDYTAEAVLLDGAGTNLTLPVALQPFEISGGIPSRTAFEFPPSAFYRP